MVVKKSNGSADPVGVSITQEIVQNNPDKPNPNRVDERRWDWSMLSYNPSITWEFVQKKSWQTLGLELVVKKSNGSADPYGVSITWEIVQNNPDKHWSWCGLSSNPSIMWEAWEVINLNKPWYLV